jgi:hypothetical protein
MKTNAQSKLALELLGYHGGQSSALYAVGSCMLSDANKGVEYNPLNHRGHGDDGSVAGALIMARVELRADFNEKRANRLAETLLKISKKFQPEIHE